MHYTIRCLKRPTGIMYWERRGEMKAFLEHLAELGRQARLAGIMGIRDYQRTKAVEKRLN